MINFFNKIIIIDKKVKPSYIYVLSFVVIYISIP